MHTDTDISKILKDKYTKSDWSFRRLLLCIVSKDAHWTPAGSQHATKASMDQCGRGSAGRELGGGLGEKGQTDPNRPGPPGPQEAAANWRFARAEEEGLILGLGIER